MAEAELQDNVSQERSPFSKNWWAFWSRFADLLFFFYPGAVSKIHQQEATEKYWILWRDVEILFSNNAEKLKIGEKVSLPHDPKDVEEYVRKEIIRIESKCKQPENINGNASQADKYKSNLKLLLYFYKILIKDRKKLTRREGDLNILWRDLTFIRTRMLTEEIIDRKSLPFHLDYCRGEAVRLGVQDSEELQEIIIDAAVDLDNGTSDNADAGSDNNDAPHKRTVRNIVRILTRLNNRRLKRLHEQRMNKIMYQTAFTILLILSCILLHAHEHVMAFPGGDPDNEVQTSGQVNIEKNIEAKRVEKEKESPAKQLNNVVDADNNGGKAWSLGNMFSGFKALLLKTILFPKTIIVLFPEFLMANLNSCKDYMKENPLFFIFFAGLTGGFLSTVMRLGQGPKDSMPGDDAYYAWYALTKPVVGALAAAILYVIFLAGFAPTEVFSQAYISAIKADPVGAKGFAFGCIMGFSERIIMPKVR